MHTIVFVLFWSFVGFINFFLLYFLNVILACTFLWEHCENIMKTRLNIISFLSSVIALIDAAGNNYEYRVNYRISYQPRNSIRGRVRTSNRVRHSKDMSDSQLRTAILLGTVFGASSWKARSNFKHKEERKSFREGLNLSKSYDSIC